MAQKSNLKSNNRVWFENWRYKLRDDLEPIKYARTLTENEKDAVELVRLIKAAKEIGITLEENEFTEVHKLYNNNTSKLQK